MTNQEPVDIALLERFGFMPRKLLREEISDIIKENGWEQRTFAKSDGTRLNPANIKVQKLDIFCDLAGSRRGYWFGEWK